MTTPHCKPEAEPPPLNQKVPSSSPALGLSLCSIIISCFTQQIQSNWSSLFCLFQAVHTPLLSPKSYIYPYRDMTDVARRKFAAMVSTVDEAVRNVTYALRKYGYYKNSVLIYSTDNGAQPFTGGSNWPLRGYKVRGTL